MKKMIIILIFLALAYAVLMTIDIPLPALKGGKKAIVSLSFDDGYLDHYTQAVPILDSFGMKGTFYIITEKMKTADSGYLDTDKVLGLYQRGHEIGSHSVNHPYVMTYGWNAWQVKSSKTDLEKLGIVVTSFAYPYGRSNFFYRKKVQASGFTNARAVGGRFNGATTDQYRLGSRFVNRNTTLEEVRGWISEAEQKGYWLILCFHRVSEGLPDEWGCTPAQLRSICDVLAQKELQVLPVSKAWKTY